MFAPDWKTTHYLHSESVRLHYPWNLMTVLGTDDAPLNHQSALLLARGRQDDGEEHAENRDTERIAEENRQVAGAQAVEGEQIQTA